MERRKQRKVVGLGAFITISTVFVVITLAMVWFLQTKRNEVIQVNQILQIEQQKSIELQSQLEEIQKQSEQMNLQVEELKEEIEILQSSKAEQTNGEDKKNKQRVAYLTFDDGPSDNTIKILDFLKDHQIQATFFVTGNENRLDIYKRIVDEGHTLGNHTYGHDYNKIYRSTEAFFADVEKLNDLLEKATGQRSSILRFPGGSNNTVSRHAGGTGIMEVMRKEAKEKGYNFFDWNVDSLDASKSKQSMDVIVKSVVGGSQYTNQAVILMHDAPAKTTTVQALPQIVEGLKKQGFIFKGLDMQTPEVQF